MFIQDIKKTNVSIIVFMNKKTKNNLFAASGGLFVGAVNGMLGAGGGMLVVPIYQKFFDMPSKRAHATAIITILPVSLISAVWYICEGVVEIKPLLLVMLGSIVGAIVGTFLLKKLKSTIVSILFYLLMFVAGIFMFLFV